MADRTVERQAEEDRILVLLRTNAEQIGGTKDELAALYDRRIELWLEGRAMDPPMRQADLGAASGVKEPAVINALRSRRDKADRAAAE